jgi:hypothetical protein
MWKLVGYRPFEALAVALLAGLITLCAVFAALYARAMQQALVDVELARAPVEVSGLTLTEKGIPNPVSESENLPGWLPDSVAGQYLPPLPQASGDAAALPQHRTAGAPIGSLVWRDDFCAHVRMLTGSCPDQSREIAVSRADLKAFGYTPGTTIRIEGSPSTPGANPPIAEVQVVGVYQQVESPYWFGRELTGRSGLTVEDSIQVQHDTWLTPADTFSSIPLLPNTAASLDYPLDPSATGVDERLAMPAQLRALQNTAVISGFETSSGLTAIADRVSDQRDRSEATVPLLMAQLGLLAVVVFWLVLGAVTEQRRSEVALTLLHGRGQTGARRRLLGELLPVALVGVLLGTGGAVLLCWAAVRFFLPGSAELELRPPVWLALLAATVALVAITAAAVWRTTREPVQTLLRSVRTRETGWRIGALETLVIAAAGTVVVVFVTGGLSGPIAVAGPTLLALVVGLLLAHATVPIAAATGSGLLGRGRTRLGVSVLNAARSPAARRTVVILTVATALLVFAADALVVGSRNRAYAAEQQTGAPLVAEVSGYDLPTVRRVLDDLDPSGDTVTPVVAVRAPSAGAASTLAVVPDSFPRIALFPGQDPATIPWQQLAPPHATPVRFRGDRLTGRVTTTGLGQVGEGPIKLTFEIVHADNAAVDSYLGTLPKGTASTRFSAAPDCAKGCQLKAIRVEGVAGSPLIGTITFSDLTAGGRPVLLGPGKSWIQTIDDAEAESDGTEPDHVQPTTPGPGQLQIHLSGSVRSPLRLQQAWFPVQIPAIVAGSLLSGGSGDDFVTNGLDGVSRDATRIASVPRVPASPQDTSMVNLDVVQRGSPVASGNVIMLWFAEDDPAALARVTAALRAAGITITSTSTLAEDREGFEESLPTWSLQLASVVGLAGLAIGGLVLLVIAVATWRLRSRDLATLRMAGLGSGSLRRIAVTEPMLAIGLAIVAGAVCGVVGAHFSLPTVPLLPITPEVSTTDLSTAWLAVGAAAVVAAAALTMVGWLVGRSIAQRATLQRIRETL